MTDTLLRNATELERNVTVVPFGFRFWDPVAGRYIADGLHVVWRDDADRQVVASHGPSGTFALRGLPGSRAFEAGQGDAAFWASPPSVGAHGTVEVADGSGRFLPFSFRIDEPERLGHLVREVCRVPGGAPTGEAGPGSPPQPEMPVLALFSAPARAIPPGMAVLYTELRSVDGVAAAGAIVSIKPPGQAPALGLADDRGFAAVLFPYPKPATPVLSPPSPAPSRLADQHWDDVGIEAYWDPAIVTRPPDLCDLLDQVDRFPVSLLAGRSPDVTLTHISLEYGRPLSVRTLGSPVLLLVPGPPTSP